MMAMPTDTPGTTQVAKPTDDPTLILAEQLIARRSLTPDDCGCMGILAIEVLLFSHDSALGGGAGQ